MVEPKLKQVEHDHTFGHDVVQPGERRTFIVVAVTAVTMVVEVVCGIMFGSMALLADGLHMASHAAALSISAFAYVYARRRARDARFSFGTGKVNALAGFTGAVLLMMFATFMVWESLERFANPVAIQFDAAIVVACLGLLVNGACALILGSHSHDHGHDHGHGHGHAHAEHGHDAHASDEHDHAEHDHNLRSAYLHVIADALTSLAAIFALVCGKFAGWTWLDPAMGIVGAVLIVRWGWGLVRDTSRILLDHQGSEELCGQVRGALEGGCADKGCAVDRVADLHVWSIGGGYYAAVVVIVSSAPQDPAVYKQRIPSALHIVHATIEVHQA